ncbi:MAG: helix-turn-helix domain-containing protein [Bacteroidales bacterium]|nr:helix-turn-helix domain-containing protein [Bacteroidales bacterium]
MIGSLNSLIEISFFTGMVCSISFALVLLLIKIPNTEYTERLRTSKNLIALCYLACAAVFWFTIHHSDLPAFERFATMMMVVITAVSVSALSYSLINLLDENYYSRDGFKMTIGAIAIFSVVLAQLLIAGPSKATNVAVLLYIIVHAVQCVVHTVLFLRTFKKSREKLANYYDEDEDHKLRWIHFCFWIMLLADSFVLVYLLLPPHSTAIYAFWYCLFMLYFTSNYISFLSSHKIMLDAFAHSALSGEDLKKLPLFQRKQQENREKALTQDGDARDKEFASLEKSIAKWVAEKKYREYDKSREEIAAELNTSKELLQLYFAMRVGVDFRTWRTGLRVEDAKQLLLEDKNSSVQVIAEISGFSDRSNFHRQFTKIVGCSPKEWRETDGHPGVQE